MASAAGMALPLLGIGTAASGVGSILSAKSGAPQATPIAPPAPVFPGATSGFINGISNNGVTALNSLGSVAATGNPTSIGDMFTQYMNQQKILTQLGQANVISGLGAQGVRYGSGTSDALELYNAQVSGNFASTLANMLFQSTESAANRQVGAASTLANLFSNAGTMVAPTQVISGGTPSPTGAGLSAAGSGISTIALLSSLGILK